MQVLKPRVSSLLLVVSVLSVSKAWPAPAQTCSTASLAVQVLGSGGPESQDKRASTSYLIWDHSHARAIVDETDIGKASVFELLRGLIVGAERAPFCFDHADEQQVLQR